MANNKIVQGQWNKGPVTHAATICNPMTHINFGQTIDYTSENKSTFKGKTVEGLNSKSISKTRAEKNNKPSFAFGNSPYKDNLMTTA